MTNGSKVRIYDLARDKIPSDLDEKTKKKVQAEFTRQLIANAARFGQSPKTASSSIDGYVVQDLLNSISINEIIENVSSGKNTTKSSVKKASAAPDIEPPKKALKIVRRITVTEQEEEKEKEEQQEAEDAAAKEAFENESSTDQEINQGEVESSPEEKEDLELQQSLKAMAESANKPAMRSQSQAPMRDMSNVRSIPLRPQSVPYQKPSIPGQPTGGQPYRVARPTSSSTGIGRKKKRGQSDDRPKPQRRERVVEVDTTPKEISITKPMTVRELSQFTEIPETEIITYFFMKKIIKTVNDLLEKSLIVEFLSTKNFIVDTQIKAEAHEELKTTLKKDQSEGNLIKRPPVVTVMGHVDHGKTTLVDTIRKTKSKIVDGESGGITQHISTYKIEAEDFDGNIRKITILDTPGHEAFTAMRKRGANVTDIIVLIVAADDGVMPQTKECIAHIKESQIPFVVAVNKIDKDGANPDKVLGQLAEYGIITQNYGGDVECAMVSALNNQNVDDLLMKVMLVADAELDEVIMSNPNRLALGTVIEAELSRTKGPLATVLVQNGTLKKGDFISAGGVHGKVKSMIDESGKLTDFADPSSAVTILGFAGVPKAGDKFRAHKNLKEAKSDAEAIAQGELEQKRFRGIYNFASEIQEGQESELRIIIKADVQGSAEAISHEINKLSTGEVLVKPIAIDSGSITSNDVQMAAQTGAVIVGFHVGADTAATAKLAEKLGVKLKSYEIIYKLTEDLERAVLGLHAPEYEEQKLGELEVRQIFEISGRKIAGSMVTSGKIVRGEIARVLRDGVQIFEGKVDYLKRFKDDAKEVKENFECGLSFEKYNDLQEGDIVQCWTVKEVARTSL
jgi:translation initiation factor IF-2